MEDYGSGWKWFAASMEASVISKKLEVDGIVQGWKWFAASMEASVISKKLEVDGIVQGSRWK